MTQGDRATAAPGQWVGEAPDVLVIGGGVMGVWAALKAARRGLTVLIAEKGMLGRGASHGHLGALMAHMPDKWNAKKQFQFDALLALEDEAKQLSQETGLASGYRRSGRLIPLPKPHLRDIALRHQAEAVVNWRGEGYAYEWRVTDDPVAPGWPQGKGIDGGYVLDTFAARAAPRSFMAMLIAAAKANGEIRICEGFEIAAIDGRAGVAMSTDGTRIAFGHCIVASGYEAFPMLKALTPDLPGALGVAVKGQSALMAANVDPALPLLFLDGLYVIPHEGGRVAIGSTSENSFGTPFDTDDQIEALIARARELVPALRDAPVIDRWAGLRPKAIERDPIAGPHPDFSRIHALAGGFKVSFGIAHRLAGAVVDAIVDGGMPDLPGSFRFGHHLRAAGPSGAQ